MKNKNSFSGKTTGGCISIFIIIFITILTIIITGGGVFTAFNDHTEQITITDKERITEAESSRYLIMGKDENNETVVYENTDCWLRGKFDSSTFYADMEVGKTYEVVLIGYRVPFLSWYENIISYKEINN